MGKYFGKKFNVVHQVCGTLGGELTVTKLVMRVTQVFLENVQRGTSGLRFFGWRINRHETCDEGD